MGSSLVHEPAASVNVLWLPFSGARLVKQTQTYSSWRLTGLVWRQFKTDPLSRLQGVVSGRSNICNVNKNVLDAVVGNDEAEATFGVEELHYSYRHARLSVRCWPFASLFYMTSAVGIGLIPGQSWLARQWWNRPLYTHNCDALRSNFGGMFSRWRGHVGEDPKIVRIDCACCYASHIRHARHGACKRG